MNRKWGLALGAGGFHGIAHLGVLRALAEAGMKPDLVAGTSAGAIAAGLYVAGAPLDEAANTIASLANPQMLDFAGGLRSMVPGVILTRTGIIQGDLVENALERLTGGRTLAQARPPVAIEAVDIVSGELVIMSSFVPQGLPPLSRTVFLTDVRLSQAIRASISIPGVFVPKQLAGRTLVDGGVRDMVPVAVLKTMGAGVVVGVDILSGQEQRVQVNSFPEVVMRAIGLLEREMVRDRLASLADAVIAPTLPPLTTFDREAIARHIRLGEEATRAQIPRIRRLLQ